MKLLMSHMTAAAMRLFQEHVSPVPGMDPYEEKRCHNWRVFEFPRLMAGEQHLQFLPALDSPHPDNPNWVVACRDGKFTFDLSWVVKVTYSPLGEYVMLSDMSVARRIQGTDRLYRGSPK